MAAIQKDNLSKTQVLEQFGCVVGVADCSFSIERGEIESLVVSTGTLEALNTVIVGSHGHTGLMHILLGSVAEHVVRKAGCPVITIKQPTGQQVESPS